MGISYNDFWELNPRELEPFAKAFSLKQEQVDSNMWVMGKYIQIAIGTCFSKNNKYPNKPFSKSAGIDPQEDMKSRFMYKVEQLNSRFTERVEIDE